MQTLTVATKRLSTHCRTSGAPGGVPVVFVHGNVSSSCFWEETMAALAGAFRGVAPDLRGFGRSEPKPIDATRGLDDFADDLEALLETEELGVAGRPAHLVGWSVGGTVAMRYATAHPDGVASLVLVNPMSPYGFGGTRDERGALCWPDHAGSGAGTVNPEFVRLLAARDRGGDSDVSPRQVMNTGYFRPPFRAAPEREDAYLDAMLETAVGDDHYPGDLATSDNWPNVAPGTRGMNNAISPKYCDLSGFARINPKPPVLWVRGADDQIVSDTSLFDLGHLGKLGLVPGWPGESGYPPQPMVAQTRAVLEAYRAAGGGYREEVVESCGHSPHIERPDAFTALLRSFLEEA